MIVTGELKELTREQAVELIGQESDKGKVIGVDNRPPKKQDGIWLVLAITGQPIDYVRVG